MLNGTIIDYFPIHDDYILRGKLKISLFVNLIDKVEELPLGSTKKIQKRRYLDVSRLISEDYKREEKKVREFVESLHKISEPSDFLAQSIKE